MYKQGVTAELEPSLGVRVTAGAAALDTEERKVHDSEKALDVSATVTKAT